MALWSSETIESLTDRKLTSLVEPSAMDLDCGAARSRIAIPRGVDVSRAPRGP